MSRKRILYAWFPYLGAERILRQRGYDGDTAVAIVDAKHNTQILSSLNAQARALGLHVGQSLRDALAISPELRTHHRNPQGEDLFLMALARWAEKFSPWIAPTKPDGFAMDFTGCAHLFGGEQGLIDTLRQDCAALNLTVYIGVADTLGAAWGLARFETGEFAPQHAGDAIMQEARATRSRAVKRKHSDRGHPMQAQNVQSQGRCAVAPPGHTRQALAPLPISALRLSDQICDKLVKLGLRRIEDLWDQPRAGLARRFGRDVVLRLDQALGSTPEPISPNKTVPHFGVRISFPDPIGLAPDITAAFDKLVQRLCARLKQHGKGARHLRVDFLRCDDTSQTITLGLARATDDPDRIRPLFDVRLPDVDPGFGIDIIRLEAVQTEPLHRTQAVGHLEAGRQVAERLQSQHSLDDLLARIATRVGSDNVIRLHPNDSHIPEQTCQAEPALHSDPSPDWPHAPRPRPLLLWPPEFVHPADAQRPPKSFRWRGRSLTTRFARGPERIAPQWWVDDPNWRSGVRDYWHITCDSGDVLWVFYAHGGTVSGGWFCHGRFG